MYLYNLLVEMNSSTLLMRVEAIEEDALVSILNTIFPKIEELAKILKIDLNDNNGLRRVLTTAIYLNEFWIVSIIKSKRDSNGCMKALQEITKLTIINTQIAFSLAREIVKCIIEIVRDIVVEEEKK